MKARMEETITSSGNLTEQVIYFRRSGIFSKIRNYNRWNRCYQKAISGYINKYGLPDAIHVHVPMRDGLIAGRLNRKYKIPYAVTEHWTIYQPQNIIPFEKQPRLFRSLLQWIIRNSRMLLPVSRDLGERMNRLVGEKEFTVIENVADTSLFFLKSRDKHGIPFRFIHVSGMGYQKNTEGLIAAFTEFNSQQPGTELLLVGPVPAAVNKMLEATGLLNKVIFTTGEVSYPEVAKQLQQADALVLFSRYENSPCSIIEALCCGLPVIATRVGGIPELVDDSNGILVQHDKQDELIKAFTHIYRQYAHYDRHAIASNASSRFNYEVIGKKLDEVYTVIKKN
jgi:glycosyltransferase involved in cell wall biosynthesis